MKQEKIVSTNSSGQPKHVVKVLDTLKAHLKDDLIHYDSISATFTNVVDKRMKNNGFKNYTIKYVDTEKDGFIPSVHLYSHTVRNLKRIIPKNFHHAMTSANVHTHDGVPSLHLEISFSTSTS